MNRLGLTDEQIAEWLVACEAWGKGRPVQYAWASGWLDYTSPQTPPLGFDGQVVRWRIKPEPVTVRAWAVLRSDGKSFVFFSCPNEAANYAGEHNLRAPIPLTGEFTP